MVVFKLSQIQTITFPEIKKRSTEILSLENGGGVGRDSFGLKEKKIVTCHGSSCKEIYTSHVSVFISQK